MPKKLKPTKRKWLTAEGKLIAVRKMDDQHLVNTIKLLLNSGRAMKIRAEMDLLSASDSLHGEQALLSVEGELDKICNMSVSDFLGQEIPTWVALVEELNVRTMPMHHNSREELLKKIEKE